MNMGHVNDCLVCGKPLLYFEAPRKLECVFCHQTFLTQAACEDGHYVCDACHSAQGIKAIREYCETAVSTDPIAMAVDIMKTPYIYMHGPEQSGPRWGLRFLGCLWCCRLSWYLYVDYFGGNAAFNRFLGASQ